MSFSVPEMKKRNRTAVAKYRKTKKGAKNYKKRIKDFKEKNLNYHREYHLKRIYGITLDDYNKMFAEQNGCCAMCGKHQSEFKQALSVDHNHQTDEIRGLLCFSCNSKLGWYEKNEKTIKNYLGE